MQWERNKEDPCGQSLVGEWHEGEEGDMVLRDLGDDFGFYLRGSLFNIIKLIRTDTTLDLSQKAEKRSLTLLELVMVIMSLIRLLSLGVEFANPEALLIQNKVMHMSII